MTATYPSNLLTSSPPSPPSPCRLDNLRRELTEAAALIGRRVESNLGQFVLPAVLQVLTEAASAVITDRFAVIEEAALHDLNSTPPSVDVLINQCLDHNDGNPGLVDWIVESEKRDKAIMHVVKLQGYLGARNGNHVRTQFQDFLVFIMDYLSIPNKSRVPLSEVCQNLKDALQDYVGGEGSAMDNAARAVNRACYGVREVTNKNSHSTEAMSETDLFELCACFKTLGAALPTIAKEFYKPPPPPSPPSPPQEVVTPAVQAHKMLAVLLQNANTEAQRLRLLQAVATQLSHTTTAAAPTTHEQASAVTTLTPQSTTPARGWEVIPSKQPTSPATSPLRSRRPNTPSQAALEAAATYRFINDRPTEPPAETGALVTEPMFNRMLNHIELVPKATLCTLPVCHNLNCGKSHSYLDVMRYNPLYKLSSCRYDGHFRGEDVAEDYQCPCIHVATGTHLRQALSAKKMLCRHGARCNVRTCTKSHSFEEMCWFNPWYKTQVCDEQCGRSAKECRRAHPHEGEHVRNPENEDDYVGKTVPMPFIERTHKPLADALEALRVVRSGAP